ncbi:MAG: hypothetical protein J6P53_02905 [Mailhella sp.]|nr:hypothetical protein [Mailhella sp.]
MPATAAPAPQEKTILDGRISAMTWPGWKLLQGASVEIHGKAVRRRPPGAAHGEMQHLTGHGVA